MGWKEFISATIDSLAWPFSIVIILLLFKREAAQLLNKIVKLKYKDLELDFQKIKEQTESLKIESRKREVHKRKNLTLFSLEEQIFESIEKAPGASILLSWTLLETAISSAVASLAISTEIPSFRSPLHNISALKEYVNIGEKEYTLLQELRNLRNKVAHSDTTIENISQEQAAYYADSALKLTAYINNLKIIKKS